MSPSSPATTWVSLLRTHADQLGGKAALTFFPAGEGVSTVLTYAELDRQARRIALALREHSQPGDRVLLLYPSGLDFVTAFFGCLYAGVVAVPAYPPRPNESAHRLRAIVADAGAQLALTMRTLLATSANFTPEGLGSATLRLLTTDDLPASNADDWTPGDIRADTLALLQYTSGSTGSPKGVMLTHDNLLANQEMIAHSLGHTGRDTISCGWLPLFHDMGLIGIMMQALYSGGQGFLMPPTAFLQKPLRWLQLMSRVRATVTAAPNFAYDLCVRRTTPEERAALDLSALRSAMNGSEPLHAETLERFVAAFAVAGFRHEFLQPCYGMAEASLMVTSKVLGRDFVTEAVDPARLAASEAIVSTQSEARPLVSSGPAAPELEVLVVDPRTRQPVPEGYVGEIWAHGPNIGLGYWNKPEVSAQTFGAKLASGDDTPYLRTGDLGYLRNGELFVTGRMKDVIIVRGRNHYPQDLEATVHDADPALRAHGGAAFAVTQDVTEGVVIVQEVERTALKKLDAPAVCAAIRAALVREHDIVPAAIVLVKPATIPKTSSGKIQRAACRTQYESGELDIVARWAPGEAPAAAAPTASGLQAWLITRVAALLQTPGAPIDPHAPLQSLGLDSLAAVTLSGELEEHLGRKVEPTIVYSHPTIEQLARHFSGGEPATATAPSLASNDSADRAIAVIGLGCRFPGGAVDPEAFWQLLRAGRDATSEIPADRWDVDAFHDADPETPGRMYVRRGAFLDGVDGFDPDFFGIAQRDAVAMDPQHRLLLELAWEALEDAAIAPTSLSGQETGVFVGVSFDDYARLAAHSGDATRIDAYSALGAARPLAAARLSYHLGLQGPSLLVDTLCSSSLLAIHLAMQSLRNGECRTALAGGANLILDPGATIASCKLRALAPDGRCKTFDASADGYARGEGAGLVVLKRLRDARADGDPILAVLRGSATNHDGRSNGLTAPNGLAQEALLRKALADANAAPADVAYIEAHGTGTVLGDPIEVQALGRVYGPDRAVDAPLLLGAVKTNVGHLESAAGVAGLIKTVLALRHGKIPANLHFNTPNPYIPWKELPVKVVSGPTAWPVARRLAGVSSFGLGGTNVHILLEAAPQVGGGLSPDVARPPAAPDRPRHLFTLSGHTPAAALANAAAWADHLAAHPKLSLADVCHTANTGRTAGTHRAALVVESTSELIAQLRALTPGRLTATGNESPGVAFLFTGQGSHYAGMAQELYATQPVFRATLDRCTELFRELLPIPLTEALASTDEALLGQTLYAQPALFAVEVALGRLWLAWGVKPTGIFGHSIGEYAAACIAGVFSLEDAAKLVAAKARLTHHLPAGGAMLAVAASATQLAPYLTAHPTIEIAALNGPAATTLAGPVDAIARLLTALEKAGIGAQRLPIAQAFHSRSLDAILAEFAAVAETVTYHPPACPLITSLHGRVADDEVVTARYWVRQMREPVQFIRGVEALHASGCTAFVEIGPKPSLSSLGQSILPRAARATHAWLPSLRPGRSDWSVLLAALGELHARGATVDWVAFDRGYARRRLGGLPTYRFQRRRCWLEVPRLTAAGTAAANDQDIPTFSVHWHEIPPPTPLAGPAGTWWLQVRDPVLAKVLPDALRARGQTVQLLEPGAPLPDGPAPRGVIVAGSPAEAFAVAQQLIAPAQPATKLWLLTQQAVATGREVAPLDLDLAPLAGFARAFALEHTAHWGGLVDLDEITTDSAAMAADELLAGSADDFVVWRKSARLVPRLLPHALGAIDAAPIAADRTQLITGGTGGLGLAVARWLIARGARHLVLMSRRPPSPELQATLAGFVESGARVRLLTGDVTVAADVRRVLMEIGTGSPALGGVFHAAGVAGFTPLAALSPQDFAAVLAPKVTGARHLHEFTRNCALDHFVMFSSIASVWGSQGQTHYAAGNAYLDALAHERHRLGLPGLSVNWGPWNDAGMAAPAAREQLRRIGLSPLPPAAAVTMLGRLMANGAPQVTAARVDWSVLRPVLTLRRPRPLLDAFAHAAPATPAGALPRSDILARLRAADPTQREAVLGAYLQRELARVLGRTDATPVDLYQGFFALGMDSLMAVELRTRLETDLSIQLPSTIAFDRATLAAMQEELAARLFATPAAPRATVALTVPAPTEPIAIIGLGCRFPGGVSNPEEFWDLLRDGRHGAKPIPAERWDAAAHYHADPAHPGTMYARAASFIDGVDQFDHAFFNLYPREAAAMDPQQRLLLETAWQALESAGLAHAGLRGSRTGTFVGVSTSDYAQLVLKSGDPTRIDAYFGTGNALNAVAGRVAYTFGLNGPALVTDTACSSSLVALHQACASLRAGECTQAIAAGVNLMLTPEPMIALSRARMLAPDGRCKTFDATADGYGRGEGCGVVILKRLSDARAAGDTVLALITGSAVNQDGASSGFTVPSGRAQQELIERALALAGRTADELDYVEAHGTGTPLGDPIEINALAAVAGPDRVRPLVVGSVKTNLGHLESAAGIAGLIKTVLALRHDAIPAHLGFTQPSPHIPWKELPVRVPTELTPWPETGGRPRVAGISAFGFTGTNAHVIVESAPANDAVPDTTPGTCLIPLSARTPEALEALRVATLAWLEARPELALADVARTLGAGRQHFALRTAYLVGSLAELRRQLARPITPAAPAAALAPLAFVCTSPSAFDMATWWESGGLPASLYLGTGAGLPAAGALAGIFSAEDAARLAADPGVLDDLVLQPPRVGFGVAGLGRISDEAAASAAWWRTALAGSPSGPAEPLPDYRELVLATVREDRLIAAAALYVAGYELDWAALFPADGGQHLPDAPTYPFQRRRHWVELATAAARPVTPVRSDAATLLGDRLALPGSHEIRFATAYSKANAFVGHHRIFGRMIASGAQHLALFIAAARTALKAESCTVSGITFARALMLDEDETRAVQLVLTPGEDHALAGRVISAPPQEGDEWPQHVAATVRAGFDGEWPAWPAVTLDGATETTGADFQGLLDGVGYKLGPSFCWVRSVRHNATGAEAVLAAPPGAVEPDGYALHPGLIDSCFQLIGWCAGVDLQEVRDGNAIYIPAAIDAVRFHRRPSTRPLRCSVRLTDPELRRAHKLRGNLQLTEEDGTLVFEVRGFEARRAARAAIMPEQAAASSGHFYELAWTEVPAANPVPAAGRYTVIGRSRVAGALATRVATQTAGEETGVVLFLDEPESSASAGAGDAARLLALVQELAARPRPPRLWVVTRGAQAVPGDHTPPSVRAVAAVGLARIAALEHPALRLTLLDLDPATPANEEISLEHELSGPDDENQLALRGPRRLAARLAPAAPLPHPGDAPVRLTLGQYGNLDTLALKPATRRALGTGEVEIEVRAVGLNFRDVLGGLGLLRDHYLTLGFKTEAEVPFGGECAGVVRAIGPGVTRFKAGDEVLSGLAFGCMGSHFAAPAAALVAKPAQLGFAEAASLPAAYLTAWYALHTLARLQPGERVLIHAAAGGVGIAAIHVAKLLGAEVIATASPGKWPALRALGVSIIGHSRQTTYAQEFPRADVVLNSLTGEHIPASLDLLNPRGRFVEIGKLGIWTPAQVAARRADVRYLAFDLEQINRAAPQTIGNLMRELAPHWTTGRLPPLPLQIYPLTEASAAFRHMAQAKHVGKIVLVRPPAQAPKPQRDGVYLVTGGLGGIGLAVTGWLAQAGAGTIVIASRKAPDAAQQEVLAQARTSGSHVIWHQADLATPGAGTALVAACRAHGTLRGVFHAAGVLDDGLLRQQTAERLSAVYAPKADAAWELHLATLAPAPDYFVLFSSLAAVLGSPGQGTYAAANAALDALAQHRQRLGRPALSINWGPWAGAGMSARLGERERARFAALGLKPFTSAAGLAVLGELLSSTAAQVAAVDLDRAALLASLGGGRVPPLLRQLADGAGAATAGGLLVTQLRATPAAERAAFIVTALGTRLAVALGLAAGETLPADRDLTSLGFDSLTAVELQSWIAGEFHVEIPMQRIAGLSLDGLVGAILSGLHLEVAATTDAAVPVEEQMQTDAQLPEDFRISGPVAPLATPRAALLTGATGFLGAFLLHELLTTTNAVIHCLVRAENDAKGRERILANLRSYGLPTEVPAARLVIVPGDLAEPSLGLDAAAFAQLAQAVDTIYHNGAWLNFFYPYGALRAANVLGTREVLRLAAQGTPKPVHYVSTSGVFYSRAYRGRALPESDPAESCAGHALGYSQTKWVAERLVTAAGERGLPITIHRAPFITGHRETGEWNSDDFICRLVRGVIALGAMPDLAASMDLVPVDYVARGIVCLTQQPASAGRRFHLCAPQEVPWSALAGWLGELGYPVQREPYAAWLQRLPALRGTDHPIAPFVPLFLEKAGPDRPTVPEVFLQSAHARLDCAATFEALAGSGLTAPVIGAALWRRYLTTLRAHGAVPAPAPSA